VVDESSGTPARSALRRHGLAPRKSLGQNFLRDRSYLSRIVDALALSADDDVLEIGPGTGVLTGALLAHARRVVAVELDDHLVQLLRDEFSGAQNLEVVAGDALQVEPADIFQGPYKLAGNIPYYITGPILRHYLELPRPPGVMVLMVQREVAARMVAAPGNLSLLGLSVQYYASPSVVSRVPRRAFHPAPKVDSAIVKVVPRQPPVPSDFRDTFFRLARAGFGTRRKTLGNALAIGLGASPAEARALLQQAGIDERRRAETLSLEEWANLTREFTRGAG
jgi:16S rRNA (adenine1518-N6/adenine1519-N6)-dimethyltransferase